MAIWDQGLQGVHLNIARDPGAKLYVLAGPGTGKTFAMMRRVARLLEEGVDPARLLVCSFTRTAARDLREQLESLAAPGADRVKAQTLHSLCFSTDPLDQPDSKVVSNSSCEKSEHTNIFASCTWTSARSRPR